MSASTATEARKRGPRPPRERLASLKDRGPRRRQRPAAVVRSDADCPNPSCMMPVIEEKDGTWVCMSCGTLISESNIVADVTFGESSTGAAVVQGAYVGEGQRHAKSMGSAFRRAGVTESREVTETQGRDEIRKQATALRINVADQAFEVYKLAITNNFIQGRRIRAVAAVCLYVACRRDPRNTTLLMDFAELIQVNVFKLGQVYQDLMKTLWLTTPSNSGVKPIIEVEWLIEKYARKLEFGPSTMKVAEDAAKIIKRMKRDWMVSGRQPAGLCGACIILAARMNNFRRTVREVVYVVKVADVTIAKRIEEFKRTASADLTVDQFREFGIRLKGQNDPPALYEARARELKRKRQQDILELGNEPQIVSDGAALHRDRSRSEQGNLRRDADGFLIPDLPIDPNILAGARDAGNDISDSFIPSLNKKRKGKTPKAKPHQRPVPEITDADLIIEDELETEISRILVDPNTLSHMEDAAFGDHEARAKALADSLRKPLSDEVSGEPEIGEEEFEDDPEVANCVLSEAERSIKERIWVTHNEDWLRSQQAKALKKSLDEANGTTKKIRRRKRRGRLGDGSVLEGDTPVESPAEATQRMLDRRGKGFSRYINYERLNEFYKEFRGTSKPGEASTATPSESDAGSEASEIPAEFNSTNEPPLASAVVSAQSIQALQNSSRPGRILRPRGQDIGKRKKLPTPTPPPLDELGDTEASSSEEDDQVDELSTVKAFGIDPGEDWI